MKKWIALGSIFLFLVGCGNEKSEEVNEDIDEVVEQEETTEQSSDEGIAEESTKEEEVSETEEESEDTDKPQPPSEAEGTREEYLTKLENVKKGLTELEKILENGTQTEMTQAQGEIFKKWDEALNEVYGELKKQLSASEMSSLREEQRKWITYRDDTAKAESLPYEGGTMQSLQYISTQTRLTEERCYELVEGYMK